MNEQPLVSVGSNNRINRSNIALMGSLATIILTGFAVYCLFPFHYWIGLGLVVMLCIVAALFLAFAAKLIAGWIIDLRARWFDSYHRPATEHGMFNLATGKHLPALPPPSVQVSMVKTEQEQEQDVDDLKILSMAEQGISGRQIEKQLGLSHHKVTTTINAWKEKHNLV